MTEQINEAGIWFAEHGLVPDSLLSYGIRRACGNRLKEVKNAYAVNHQAVMDDFVHLLNSSPIAEATDLANEQHYELPPEFFGHILGPRRKYSGCDWNVGVNTLAEAEEASLACVVERAQIRDGQQILELGCGWGSLSLYLAQKFPGSRIVSVSNSKPQREYIEAQRDAMGLINLEIVTADINEFEPAGQFDRIVTIEMLEHVRNYPALFGRFSHWLRYDGLLFIHVFRHNEYAYTFEVEGSSNWMGRHFFTGGVMPSHDLFMNVQSAFALKEDWQINGQNYARTADAWLENMDKNRKVILQILDRHHDCKDSKLWFQRWRMFFMACRELFGYEDGLEWGVSHYLFQKAEHSSYKKLEE